MDSQNGGVKPPFALAQGGDLQCADFVGDNQMRRIRFELLEDFPAPAAKYPARSRGAVELILPALEEPPPKTRGAAKQPPVRANVQRGKPGARRFQGVQQANFDRINAIVEGTLEDFRRANMPRAHAQGQDENAFGIH
jgi:hypothetical protein